ncbi:MAG: hypothetical protein US74_C0014G0008 [Parcubacteria group bacterium GW2011_GWA2_38_13]|nr:MAG: hypothetical protein US74_C0014G0008 [Parcubacteria group bacterium GW2011_GWA2_38_13]
MFEKLKQFRDLRSKAKTIQNVLSEIIIENEASGIKLVMDGNQKIQSIKIQENLTANDVEKILPNLFNDTIKKVQRVMAEKMQAMGGLDQFKM